MLTTKKKIRVLIVENVRVKRPLFCRYVEKYFGIFFENCFGEFLNFSPFTAPPPWHNHDGDRKHSPAWQAGRRVICGPPLCLGRRNSASHSACQNEAPHGGCRPPRRVVRCWPQIPHNAMEKLQSTDRGHPGARPLKQAS